MEQRSILLAHKWQKAAWAYILFFMVFLLAYAVAHLFGVHLWRDVIGAELSETRLGVFLVLLFFKTLPCVSLMVVCLSKEKNEDEYIGYIRSVALLILVLFLFVLSLFTFACEDYFRYLVKDTAAYQEILAWYHWFTLMPILAGLYLILFKGLLFIDKLRSSHAGE